MPAITLTSDWGKSGCYLPQLKGSLLSLPAEGFSLETISDSIEPFDVEEACFILKHSFPFFPKGSIHILAVSGKLQQRAAVSIVCSKGFFFIGEDDGRFSLLFENYDSAYHLVPRADESDFVQIRQICRAVRLITESGGELEPFIMEGELEPARLLEAAGSRAVVMPGQIIGHIVHIDCFGNAITDIGRDDFLKLQSRLINKGLSDGSYTIFAGGPRLKFNRIDRGYDSAESGENIAFFNSCNLLELAVNGGNIARSEGLERRMEIMIRFNIYG